MPKKIELLPGHFHTGNIVKCRVSNDAAYYAVVAIDGINHKIMLSGPRRGTWYDMDKIKPVVLTEKLLDTICSKKEHTYWHFYENDSCAFILQWGNEKKKAVWVGYFESSIGLVDIQYLHELQNIYAVFNKSELDLSNIRISW